MRAALTSLLVCLLAACSGSDAAKVSRLELTQSGTWAGLEVAVNSQGRGEYVVTHYPAKQSGSFAISPQQFASLVNRLEPYRHKAAPYNEQTMRQFIDRTCPKGVPEVTDQGAIWVHWIGPSLNEHFLADLGCDVERNALRNKELVSIVSGLPVPRTPKR